MSIKVRDGLPIKGPRGGAGATVTIDGVTKVHSGYKTVDIDGPDLKNTTEILKEHFPGTKDKAAENVEKQEREQRDGETILYPNGAKLRLPGDHAETALRHMRRTLRKGPPATRPTFMMPAYVKKMSDGTRRVVREGDPDY